jgi:hypothetical protein
MLLLMMIIIKIMGHECMQETVERSNQWEEGGERKG